MAQMPARMERDGLIARRPDPKDGRRRTIRLTDEAAARLPEAIATLVEGNERALAGFMDEEASRFIAMLERVIANLDRTQEPGRPHGR